MKRLPSRRKKRSPAKTKRSKRSRKSSSQTAATKKNTEQSAAAVAYLGLGSNLGDRGRNLEAAVSAIARRARLLRVSSFYRTEPVGHADQPDFWNAAAEIAWSGSPGDLLKLVQEVEREGGRSRSFRGGPREIDVDILDLRGVVRPSPDPVLPHPRLVSRRFALAPLAEIAPRWRHPVTGETAKAMMAALPRRPSVKKVVRPRRA